MTTLTRVARLAEDGTVASYITLDLDSLTAEELKQVRVVEGDEDARPLPGPTYPAQAEVDGQPVVPGYEAEKVAELQAEVTRRNAQRAEGDQVVVEAPGNKAEIVAALEADDARA